MRVRVRVCVRVRACACACVCMCVCMCVRVCPGAIVSQLHISLERCLLLVHVLIKEKTEGKLIVLILLHCVLTGAVVRCNSLVKTSKSSFNYLVEYNVLYVYVHAYIGLTCVVPTTYSKLRCFCRLFC